MIRPPTYPSFPEAASLSTKDWCNIIPKGKGNIVPRRVTLYLACFDVHASLCPPPLSSEITLQLPPVDLDLSDLTCFWSEAGSWPQVDPVLRVYINDEHLIAQLRLSGMLSLKFYDFCWEGERVKAKNSVAWGSYFVKGFVVLLLF